MERPRSRAARREGLLDEAVRAFSRRGYHEVSLDELAVRSSISKPGLYAYFGSKAGIYAAALKRASDRLSNRVEAAVATASRPEDQMWRGICALLDFVEENRDGFFMLQREATAGGGPFSQQAVEAHNRMASLIAGLFRTSAQRSGLGGTALTSTTPMAHGFVGTCEALARWWVDHPEVPKGTVAMYLMNAAWMGLGDLLEGRYWMPGSGR